MALIRCPECGKENVSDSAVAYPNCGFGISQYYEHQKKKLSHQSPQKAELEDDRKAMEAKIAKKIAKHQEKEKQKMKQEKNKLIKNPDTLHNKLTEAETRKTSIVNQLKKTRNTEIIAKLGCFAWSAFWTIVLLWSFSVSDHGSHGLLIVISLFLAIIGCGLLCVTTGSIDRMEQDLKIAEEDIHKYEELVQQRIKQQHAEMIAKADALHAEKDYAEYSQTSGAEWGPKYFTDPCPYCGHYKVRYSKWEDKRFSIAFWGIASSKIGKAFKCENCNRMW